MIKVFTNEKFNNVNAYLVINDDTNEAILIDTADMIDDIKEYIYENNIDLENIILTHGHFDHVCGVDKLLDEFPLAKGWIQLRDKKMLYDPKKNLSLKMINKVWRMEYKTNLVPFLKEVDLKTAGYKVKIKPYPGHTKGGVIVELPDIKSVFIGDVFFIKDEDMIKADHKWHWIEYNKTLKTIFKNYSDDWKIYPGHYDYGFTLETMKKL